LRNLFPENILTMLKNTKYIILPLLFTLLTHTSNSQPVGFDIKTVVIDPGHGGKDPGATIGKVYEKDIILNVALATGKLIKEQFPDVKVIYTRDKDVFIQLDQRAILANKQKSDLFISIHANTCSDPKTFGTETYILGQHRAGENLKVAQLENSVILLEDDYTTRYEGFDPNSAESYIMFELIQNEFLEQSRQMANFVENSFTQLAKRKSRGVRQDGFLVLRNTSMPSILIELGFISNSTEKEFLTKEENQNKMAQCIASSFASYKNKYGSKSINTPSKSTTSKNAKTKIPEPKKNAETLETNDTQNGTEAQTPNNKADIKKSNSVDKQILPLEKANITSPFYAIQIAANPTELDKKDQTFNNLDTIYTYQENNLFKYYCHPEKDYNLFLNKLKQTKNTVSDAFPVIFIDGKKSKFRKLP